MDNPIITTNDVGKNDKFAVAGFVLSFALFIFHLINWFLISLSNNFYNSLNLTLVRILSQLFLITAPPQLVGHLDPLNDPLTFLSLYYIILLRLAIPLVAVILAVIGIIRIKLNKGKKGLWFAITGICIGTVVLIYYWFINTLNIGIL